MFKNVIISYTNKITKKDIIDFSLKNNVVLTNDEVDTIYDEIRNNINEWLEDSDKALIKLKDKLQKPTYLEIQKQLNFYKEKYKNYL